MGCGAGGDLSESCSLEPAHLVFALESESEPQMSQEGSGLRAGIYTRVSV